MINGRVMLMIAAISGFICVALGAFGAHGLKAILDVKQMAWLKTGLEYQAIHTLALLGLGVLTHLYPSRAFKLAGLFFVLGILFFSGSLYMLALSTPLIWVYITPLGGFCFLIGWFLLLVGARRLTKKA